MLPRNDRYPLFGQQEFSLLGAPEAVKLPGVFDPDLVAAAAKISERNDLWESWPCGFLDQVVIGGGWVRSGVLCVGVFFHGFRFSVPSIGDASRLTIFHKKLCEKVLGVDCTETESQ